MQDPYTCCQPVTDSKARPGQHTWLRLKRALSRIVGPRMVGGWVRGDGVYLAHTRISNQSCIFEPERLQVEDHVFIGHFSVLDATYGLSIGEGCQIGFFTGIFTHSSHVAIRLYGRAYVDTPEKSAYFTAPVKLGAYCFIGAHATVLPGTTLGKGCLVSAYSLVRGQFEDFSVVAGNPAKRIGDTREMDAPHLQQHPELQAHYAQWAR
jgi:acetyltransferase-like isoleucine patch superfamily enzyme